VSNEEKLPNQALRHVSLPRKGSWRKSKKGRRERKTGPSILVRGQKGSTKRRISQKKERRKSRREPKLQKFLKGNGEKVWPGGYDHPSKEYIEKKKIQEGGKPARQASAAEQIAPSGKKHPLPGQEKKEDLERKKFEEAESGLKARVSLEIFCPGPGEEMLRGS